MKAKVIEYLNNKNINILRIYNAYDYMHKDKNLIFEVEENYSKISMSK